MSNPKSVIKDKEGNGLTIHEIEVGESTVFNLKLDGTSDRTLWGLTKIDLLIIIGRFLTIMDKDLSSEVIKDLGCQSTSRILLPIVECIEEEVKQLRNSLRFIRFD